MSDVVTDILLDEKTQEEFAKLKSYQQSVFTWQYKWLKEQAHKHQIEPAGDWWSIWLMLAGRGAGKQLCVDTPIPTPTGWVRNGDLKDGDLVFDERGNVCRVVQAHPITMPKSAYRMTFSDGSFIDADGDHLWTTLTHRARKQMTRHGIKQVPDDWPTYKHPIIDCHHNVLGSVGAETLTTVQIKESLTHSARKDLNHCIPATQPLNLPDAQLPIDPYLFGSWLGDGASKDQVIWGHIDDISLIQDYVASLGYDAALKQDKGNTYGLRIQGLSTQLKSLGVFKNKHVPTIYLRASVNQRLELLRGLMDTDGYQDTKSAEFCNTNQRLAQAVYELAVSLGEKPVMKESRAMLNGRDCGEKYRVTWRWNRFNPFKMERKRIKMAAPEAQSFRHGHRMIVSIEPIEPKPMRCITVDSPSRLYLAGEAMIPTHNTRAAAETLAWWAWEKPKTRWLVSAPTSGDLKSTCFEGDSGLLKVIPPNLIAKYNSSLHEILLINGSLIKGIPASEPERFRGPQFHGGWCCPAGTMITMADGWHKPIETVQVGDIVATRHGPRMVTASGISGNTNSLVSIGCGVTRLTATIDHPILVDNQWVPAGDIKQGDKLWVTSTSAKDTLTESSMNNTMGKSLKDGLFITKMKIKGTTILQTLKQCQDQNINHFMPKIVKDVMLNGMRRAKRLKTYVLLKMQSVFIAIQHLYQTLPLKLVSSAPEIALNNGVAINSFLNNETAMSAEKNISQSKSFKSIAANNAMQGQQYEPIVLKQREVLSVEQLPNCVTYNLTVEGEHEYIANGVVVHNCDELAAWEYLRESWDMIQFGIRLGERTKLICSTTPKPKEVVMELIEREGDDVTITRASTYSNIANLAKSFQKQILQYEGTNLGRQEIHAEIIDPEEGGIVQREWFRLWPNNKPFPKLEYILQSYDCATSDKTINDPTGCITLGVFKPIDGGMCVMILDCWQDHLQYPQLRPKVIDEFETIYGEGRDKKLVDVILVEDKSAGISLIQDLQQAHLPVIAYNPGRADKVQRLSIVANIIKAGRVWVPESGVKKGFVRDWAEGMVSQICSFPEGTVHDEFVDCFVSGTLIRMADGSQKAIESMQTGDMVATPFGPKPVVSAWCSGTYPVYEVTAGDRSLIGTPNHPFMANDEWTAVDRLNPLADTVYFYQGEEQWPSNQQEFVSKALRSMDTSTTGIQTQSRKHIEITIRDQAHFYIAQCGSFITAQFRKAIKSITLMATVAITKLQTLCALRSKSIEPNTLSCIGLTSNESILLESETKRLNGTSLQKALIGTSNMPSNAQRKPINQSERMDTSKSHTSVSGVGLKDLRITPARDSAQHGVNLPSQASALVKQVRNTHTMQKVFNLEVGEVNCYFANDILVHNCISQGLRYLRDAGWISIDFPRREGLEEEDITDAEIYNQRGRENPYGA